MNNIVLVSGGFDPIHSGHIKLLKAASKHGKIVVLLNSDKWLINKKGKAFLDFSERKIIMLSIKNVIDVIDFDDSDTTCIKGIKNAINKYTNHSFIFANGGDRNNQTTPEKEYCDNNNIETLWSVGGSEKANSSSWILKKWEEKKLQKIVNRMKNTNL